MLKKHYMLFHRSRIKSINFRKIYINEINIDKVSYTTFSGVIVDQTLSWAYHVNYIQTKTFKVGSYYF